MSEQQNINNEQEIKEENVVNTENDKINENNKEQNDSPEKEKKCKKRISRKIKIIIISMAGRLPQHRRHSPFAGSPRKPWLRSRYPAPRKQRGPGLCAGLRSGASRKW